MLNHVSIGVRDIALPIAPETVWRALSQAKDNNVPAREKS